MAKTKGRFFGVAALTVILIFLLAISAVLFSKYSSRRGTYIQTNSKNDFVLVADGRPFTVRGVCYSPIPPGESYLYNWWGDPARPWMVDGRLMKEAGINTIRLYEAGGRASQVKQVISDLYTNYGIRTIMGHGLGFWDFPHANYADPDFQHKIKREVYQMLKQYKNEPGILAWVLGNEANYSFDGKINPWSTPELDAIKNAYDRKIAKAKIYYGFLNELAGIVKKVDPSRPVGFGNGELGSIEVAKEYCPDFDFVGIIIYRGKSFGNLFRQLRDRYGRPSIIIEFGCDSYNAKLGTPDEENQAFFLKNLWRELSENTYFGNKEGNCLGGCIFEWNDEWWKYKQDDPKGWPVHNTEAGWTNGSYYFDIEAKDGLNMNEEWWGILGLDTEKEEGVNKRVLKKAYNELKKVWGEEVKKPEARDWR